MNKKKILLLPAFLTLLLSACSGGTTPTPTPGPTPPEPEVVKYTVTFANTTMASVEINQGQSLSKPSDPSKEGYIFGGWYLDDALSNEASFPITINSNTTIYAKWYSYEEAFTKARNKTIGQDVPGYEYDYTMNVTGSYSAVEVSGTTTGNAKYNKNGSNGVTFYDEHTNSGLLFYDGSKYQIKKGNALHIASTDSEGNLTNYKIKTVSGDFAYDSSSFAKAVFEYEDSSIKNIQKTSTANEYKLNTSFNFSSGVALVGNYVNHPFVVKLIGELPETSVNTGMYVTFSSGELKSYRYEMSISVAKLTLSITYNLTFKNIGSAPTINPKTFDNTAVDESSIQERLAEIESGLNAYRAKEHSGYAFSCKSAVGFDGKNDINANVRGDTKRKVDGSTNYFWNEIEVDTDLKNADLYKNSGLKDVKVKRTKLSTGEVYQFKKGLIKYGDGELSSITAFDNFYMLDNISGSLVPSFIKKSVDGTKTIYQLGMEEEGALALIKAINNSVNINPANESSVTPKLFGTLTDSSFNLDKCNFKFTFEGNNLSKIELLIKGSANVAYESSRDFTSSQLAKLKLEVSIETNNSGNSFEPYNSASDAK